jgi:hypothetical protein
MHIFAVPSFCLFIRHLLIHSVALLLIAPRLLIRPQCFQRLGPDNRASYIASCGSGHCGSPELLPPPVFAGGKGAGFVNDYPESRSKLYCEPRFLSAASPH